MGDKKQAKPGLWQRIRPKPPNPSSKNISVALQLMAIMLESGVGMTEVFNAVRTQMDDAVFEKTLEDIEYKVTRQGWKLSQAFAQYPQIFPAYCVLFVQAGEATGDMASRLRRAGLLMERNDHLVRQVKSAMTAPLLTVVVASVILYSCVKFVMPRFIDMYAGMNVELPQITQIVIQVVNIANHPLFFISLITCAIILKSYWTEIQERAFDRALQVPLFERWIGIVLGAQFCDILGSLVKEGVSLVKAVQMIAHTAPFRTHRLYLKKFHAALLEEGDFAESMASVSYFPSMLTTVAAVGQEVGNLDTLLGSMSNILEQEVDMTIRSIVTLLEPIMICGLGVITAFFFVGLFMPVYGMLSDIGG